MTRPHSDQPITNSYSPWGTVTSVSQLAHGVWKLETNGDSVGPSGGLKLSRSRNRWVHWVWRSRGGWYGDAQGDWAIPFLTFGDLLAEDEGDELLTSAIDAAMDSYPFECTLAFDPPVQKERLSPGVLVTWEPKVGAEHVPDGHPLRVYAYVDPEAKRDAERFIDVLRDPNVTSFGTSAPKVVVVSRTKWVGRQRCRDVLHDGLLWCVAEGFLRPVV